MLSIIIWAAFLPFFSSIGLAGYLRIFTSCILVITFTTLLSMSFFNIGSKFVVLLISLCLAMPSAAQPGIASLVAQLPSTPDSASIDIYRTISDYYKYSHPDSARYYIRQGITRFSASGFKRGVASLTNMLGRVEANHGNLPAARQLQKEALTMFTELGNRKGIAVVHNSLGVIDGMQGKYDSATTHFLIALREYKIIGYKVGIVDAYINLGRVANDFRNYDKALQYYREALALSPDSSGVRNVCNLYNNIAIIYGELKQYDTAMMYLKKALAGSNKSDFVDVYAYSLLNIGIVYTNTSRFDSALLVLNEALAITREKGMQTEYANILINIAGITGRTNPAKAIAQLNEVVQITSATGEKGLLLDAWSGLAELHKKTGNYKEVVVLMEKMKALSDSVSGIQKSKEIANLQAVYELEQTNNKIARLTITQQQQTMRRNILFTIVTALVLFIIGILFYLRKIKHLNTALHRREQQLQAANSIKDKLFSIIGHDLRGPIGSITMMLALLEEDATQPDEAAMLHTLHAQAGATLDTLDKLLFWGKEQIKGKSLELTDIDVAIPLHNALQLLSITAAHKHITISNVVPPGLHIHADAAHFDFIMRNLVSNAIKFSNTYDTVQLSADTTTRPGYIVFAVKDNGIGIPADRLPTIFDPFTSSEGTAQEKGTGIGLMLCKEFVTANHGHLWATSTPGLGTTFFCALPAAG